MDTIIILLAHSLFTGSEYFLQIFPVLYNGLNNVIIYNIVYNCINFDNSYLH
jgi:hypothetical protein